MNDRKDLLKNQIIIAGANVQYTYIAHWIMVNRFKKYYLAFKIIQIFLTAFSAGGFLASVISGISNFGWVGGATSAFSLAINLYMLNFNLPDNIKQHKDAAVALWEVREYYKSLVVDYDSLEVPEVRDRRDNLIQMVNQINKRFPGTDEKSFKKAQKDIGKYEYINDEAEKVLHMEVKLEDTQL